MELLQKYLIPNKDIKGTDGSLFYKKIPTTLDIEKIIQVSYYELIKWIVWVILSNLRIIKLCYSFVIQHN